MYNLYKSTEFLSIYISLASLIKLYLIIGNSRYTCVKLNLDLTQSSASNNFVEKWCYAILHSRRVSMDGENSRLLSTYVLKLLLLFRYS